MAPATVPQTTTPRKPATAFYAHLHGIAGALAQVEGQIGCFCTTPRKGTFQKLY
jgi:hypothetical protein